MMCLGRVRYTQSVVNILSGSSLWVYNEASERVNVFFLNRTGRHDGPWQGRNIRTFRRRRISKAATKLTDTAGMAPQRPMEGCRLAKRRNLVSDKSGAHGDGPNIPEHAEGIHSRLGDACGAPGYTMMPSTLYPTRPECKAIGETPPQTRRVSILVFGDTSGAPDYRMRYPIPKVVGSTLYKCPPLDPVTRYDDFFSIPPESLKRLNVTTCLF
jgi:hypothetical protein